MEFNSLGRWDGREWTTSVNKLTLSTEAGCCFQYLFLISSFSDRETLPLLSFTLTIYFEKFQTYNKNKRILQQKHSDLDSTDILLFF